MAPLQFPMAAWRAGTDRIQAAKTVDMLLRLDNATRCPHIHSRRKSSSKLLDLKDKGRRDHTLTIRQGANTTMRAVTHRIIN
jgi:hypothetical protein